ncbi:MAG: hypothetical protein EOR20_19940 [Mesorhizobium sp.]|nr:MAG: hypothetical protein EOR20_19940 [Mesorhizobium sp.]
MLNLPSIGAARAAGREPVVRPDHARSALAEWVEDYNTERPHSALSYQPPATFAATLTTTGEDAALFGGSASSPVARATLDDMSPSAEALIEAG